MRDRVLALLVLVLGFLFFLNHKTPDVSKASGVLPTQVSVLVGQADNAPVRIIIPKIKVDALVESLGLTKDGSIDVPAGPLDVSWYNLGPVPGDVGSSVISGHFGWKDNIPAVFDKLSQLQIGDKVYIQNNKKEMKTFVVRKIKIFNSNEKVPEVFLSASGAHLNLITCGGIWNAKDKSYSERRVVFTDLVN